MMWIYCAAIAVVNAQATNQIAIPLDLVEEALVYHLREGVARKPIGLIQGFDEKTAKPIELPKEVLERVLRRSVEMQRFIVPTDQLRFPAPDEKDPKDPERRWRGIERKSTGQPVPVLHIWKIAALRENAFQVSFLEYWGPLGGHAGSYLAEKIGEGWVFRRTTFDAVF